MSGFNEWWAKLSHRFYINFIKEDRWRYLTDGLANTLKITLVAVLIGIVIGVVIALIRSTHDNVAKDMKKGFTRTILNILNAIANIYLTVIRGTPAVVQLMIAYLVIFASSNNKLMVSMIAFGINSGAYVAEVIRSGIQSVDRGQTEAGRSLGLNFFQTQRYIVLPQAFKNILPALANEFITLLKETSVAGYIGMQDLTKGGDIIISRSYDAFMPLLATALIYLVMVLFFTWLVGKLERRLHSSDH